MSETMDRIKRKSFTTRWLAVEDDALIPAGTGGIITGWRSPTEIRVLLDQVILHDGTVAKGWFTDLNLGKIKIGGHIWITQKEATSHWSVGLEQIIEDGLD